MFVVLTTSGLEVARRRNSADLAAAGAEALRQMRELHLLPGLTVSIDATDSVVAVGARLKQILDATLFRVHATEVCTGQIEGMQHLSTTLATAAGFDDISTAMQYA